MGLEINQVFGRVGINKADAFINIKSRIPQVKVESSMPRVRIDIQHGQVTIDQKQCFCEVGLKTADIFAKDMAQKSRSEGFKAIAAIAQKGDTLARVDKNPKAIPVLAKSAMVKRADYTVEALPKSRPRINFSSGIEINWDMGDVDLQAVTVRPEVSATRAGVEVYMRQKASLEISNKRDSIDTII
ncbi:MAG: DUF6470 family protein [Bacillota bacterium]|nr:DUF6470 family protein [Bacillota bacterium]MDD3297988.1 DUF6470 family protein [Bacillota bacterium]MDD3851477.1 DUF6470 family protein [Bacillota bacterium]MDD4707766.1 DUF6470 family protein [Bacillota bacterium]